MKQILKTIMIPEEGLVLEPESVQEVLVETDIIRAFAYLFGKSGDKRVSLECTLGGILKVTSTGTIFEDNEGFAGTAADAWSAALGLTGVPQYLEIWTRTFGMEVQRSTDGIVYQDAIWLEVNSYYEINASTMELRIRNAVPGSNATYRIQCWR